MGNGLVELALFLPLAFFLIFVVVDAGFWFSQRAALLDTFQAGIDSEGLFSRTHRAIDCGYHPPFGYHCQLDNANLEALLEQLATEIEGKIDDLKTSRMFRRPEGLKSDYLLTLKALELRVNPRNGALQSFINGDLYREVAERKRGGMPEKALIPIKNCSSKGHESCIREYISQKIDMSRTDLSFSIPIGPIYDPTTAAISTRYQEISLLIYAEVQALSGGVGGSMVKSFMGNSFRIVDRALFILRNQSG